MTGGAGELYQKDDFVMLPDASLMFVGGGATYGLYNAAKAEYHTHPNLNKPTAHICLGSATRRLYVRSGDCHQ